MTTEQARKIADFVEFLNEWVPASRIVVTMQEDETLGTILHVYFQDFFYRNQLNVFMASLDAMTGIVANQRVSKDGDIYWRLW